MIRTNRIISVLALAFLILLGGCATDVTSREVPFIPGSDTSNVNIFVEDDTGKIILSGQVKRGVDKANIEKYLREELGYKNISNLLTVQ